MKYLLLAVLMSVPTVAFAATAEWDRNNESDMKDYQVWACFTPNCVLIKSASTLQPNPVPQTAVGVKPTYIIDLANKEGVVAISARDLANNESPLSVLVPFDKVAPGTPANPILR